MYRLCFKREFTALHRLVGGDWGAENELHGHPYRVEWELRSSTLDGHGFLVDLVEVERSLAAVTERYGGAILNDLPEFKDEIPPSSASRGFSGSSSPPRCPAAIPCAVRLWESSSAWAGYE